MAAGLQDSAVKRILQAYGFSVSAVLPAQKGYRNQSYPVALRGGQVANFILYKDEPGIVQKIKTANAVADFLAARDFPARQTLHNKIVCLRGSRQTRYGALYRYLAGNTIPWEAYTKDHIKLLGKAMSDMHHLLRIYAGPSLPDVITEYSAVAGRMQRYFSLLEVQRALGHKLQIRVSTHLFDDIINALNDAGRLPGEQPLHMDFVRSNILFAQTPHDDSLKVSIGGILDFEKAAHGHPVFDIARTLSFLLVDCKYKSADKIRKYFLASGYIKRGAASTDERGMQLLEPLIGLFLCHDFYKFLRHNPYEYLPQNEHFVRTLQMLQERGFVVPTTTIARPLRK